MTHAAEYRLIAHAVAAHRAAMWQPKTIHTEKDTPHERPRTS